MSIRKLPDGRYEWRHRVNGKHLKKTFARRADAVAYDSRIRTDLARGPHVDMGARAVSEIDIDGEPTAVYRLFNQDNALLYVGVTRHIPARFAQHEAEKPWWPQVTRKTMTWYGSRSEALAIEAAAIHAEAPAHNVAGGVWATERDHQTGDRHRETPISLRFPSVMRAELESYARDTGQPVRRVMADAVKAWLDKHAGSTT